MPKRILEDGRVVLTKDEFVSMMLRDLKIRKLKRQNEERELYGDLDDLDYSFNLNSKSSIKDDLDIDELMKEAGINSKEIVNDIQDVSISNKKDLVTHDTKKKTTTNINKKNNKKEKKVSTIIEKAILQNVIPTYEIKGVATKDGNEQLAFSF